MVLGYLTDGMFTRYVMGAFVLLAGFVCIWLAPAVISATGKADPREVVADEFAGQALTFLLIGPVPVSQVCTVAAVGFLSFRLFDIVKPWPIRRLEKLPDEWGILADDLLAGVYAWLTLLVCSKFLIPRLSF
jgi:phosphatidylglycerophosphatase A